MSASGTLEKLLPSLYEFLSVRPSDGHARSSAICSSVIAPDLPYTSLAVIADSYTRWRRCITVWRRVIGNDCVFLTLLLHAGCLWSPNYAALHRARRDIATRAEQERLCAQRASASGDTLSLEAGHEAAAREQDGNVRQRWATPTADAPHGTPVKRRGKRGGKVAAEAAAHSACALAAAAEAHAELAEMCPSSTWALHVLHFLRVEEVCVVPCSSSSSSTAKSERPSNTTRTNSAPSSCALEALHDGSGDSSESELGLRSGSSRTSRSGSQDSHSSNIESERTVGDEASDTAESRVVSTRRPVFGRGRCAARNRGGRGARQRGAKRQCGAKRGQRGSASGGDNSRKKWCRHDGDASREARSPGSAPHMQWTASSSLLPRLSHKESDRVGGGKHLGSTLAAVLTLLQKQEQCDLSTRCGDRSVDTGAKGRDGALGHGDTQELGRAGTNTRDAGSKAFTVAHTTAEQKYAVLLRAVITLVSEEEPLVQQVATALVNEWLDLVSEETLTLPLRRTAENEPTAAKDDETACFGSSFPLGAVGSAGSATRRKAALTGMRPSSCTDTPEQALRHRRVCEARHYWFSCLLKMVAYLDGIHSALREENAHIGAVLARQGIAPQDAEDIFTKSLPAIFNCALVEEVLHSASTGSPASQASALSAWAAPSLLASAQAAANFRLWMPPPVLLLPFHLIGRESVLGVWIPASVASDGGSAGHPPAASTSTRAQGRLVPCVVDSYGLHLGTEPLSGCGMQKPRGKSGGEKHTSIVEAPRACKRASVGLRGQETAPRPLHPERSLEHSRLGFAVYCAESESLLEKRYLASLENLLPILCAPGTASQLATDGDLRSDQPEPQSSTRWWPCTLSETAGSPRMDVYVARTLLMLPIPAQSTLDSSTDHAVSATRVDAGASAGACVVDGAHRMGTRTRNMLGVLASSSGSVRAPKKRPRGGFNRWSTMSVEEQAVRCQHPLLYHAMRVHLRADKFLSKAGSDTSENGGAELVLLYGDPRGEEAIALRHMGFTVRTGSHHRLGRGSAVSARRMGSSAVASVTELSSGASGGSGRLTLARDALGTTLEGVYLIARRVLGLQGLFLSSASTLTTPATAAAEARVGGKGRPSTTGAAAFEDGGPRASSKGITTTSVASFPVCAQTEREALGIAAATLALTCLVLSHSLLDDLLEQPSVVLWTTELASFIVDVSLLMPRPVPRLLKADGFALALLLQPAQSLLLMVGLAATLVIREVDMVAATHRDGEAGSVKGGGRWRGSSSASQPVMSQWHPWWSAFRTAVLRDTELPSCLYSGIWTIVESAEGSLATFAAEVRRDTSGNRQAGNGRCRRSSLVAGSDGRDDDAVAAAPVNMSGSAGVGGGRRVLSLSVPSPPAPADRYPLTDAQDTFLSKSSDATPSQSSGDGAAPYRHRLLLKVPSAGSAREQLSAKTAVHHTGHAVACGEGSVVSARQSCTPRRLCGHAVLFQDDDASRAGSLAHDVHAAASLLACADGVCVLSGSETALLGTSSVHAQAVPPVSRPLSLSLTGPTLLPRRTSAVASALWASLEAQEMRWSTGAA